MTLVRIGPNHEVVIPKRVRTKLGINPGDYVEVKLRDQTAMITPRQESFPETNEPIGPKTRAAIRRALKDVEEGRVYGPFETAEELIARWGYKVDERLTVPYTG